MFIALVSPVNSSVLFDIEGSSPPAINAVVVVPWVLFPPSCLAVAIYDGSVWSTGAYFPTNIQQQGGFGDLTAGVVNGGNDGAHRNETVEYVAETTAANIVEITTS